MSAKLSDHLIHLLLLACLVSGCLPATREDAPKEDLGVVIDRNVPVPMRDGTILRADVYRPDRGGPYPVLVQRTPYSKDRGNFDRFVKAGYIVVIQDVRGKYESEGKALSLWPVKEHAQDGYDTVEWAARLPGSSGKVGTFGVSALAGMQWRLASLGPPSLVAMSARMVMARRDDQDPTRTLPPYNVVNFFANEWTPEALRRANRPGIHTRWEALKLWEQGLCENRINFIPWLDTPQEVFQHEADVMRSWLKNPLFDPLRLDEGCKHILVPNLEIAGWYDFCNGGSIVLFQTMIKEGKTDTARKGSRIIIGPWPHSGAGRRLLGAFDFGPDASLDPGELQIRWFDYWLKGKQNGMEKTPPVKIFVMGDNKWRDEQHWPLKRAKSRVLFLTSGGKANTMRGDGRLIPERPEQPGSDQYVYDPNDPVPTLFDPSLHLFPADQRALADREDILVYSTEPLTERVEVTGNPVVELFAASSALDTDWLVKLIDVAPDGLARNVAEGVVRARYRNGFDKPELLTPEAVVKYTIPMKPTSNAFLPGHRIRLHITSSDFPTYPVNHNTAVDQAADGILKWLTPGAEVKFTIRTNTYANEIQAVWEGLRQPFSIDITSADQDADATLVVANQTIYHGGQHPTRIILPWIPNPIQEEKPVEEKPEPVAERQTYPLHQAAADGELDQVRQLLSKGADVNTEDAEQRTPLHYAIQAGKMEVVRLLVEVGADINPGPWTVLHSAAEEGRNDMAQLLIAQGADVNAKNINRRTPLHTAVASNRMQMAQLLIAQGADINAKDDGGRTPLYTAVASNRMQMAQLLIAQGADVNAKNNSGLTLLHRAVGRRRSDMAQLLIAQGADINAKDADGRTPLYTAVASDRMQMAQLLIAQGADINAKDSRGLTALHSAAVEGRRDVAEFLLAREAGVDGRDDNYEFTALHYAARFGSENVAEVLVAHGADIKAKDKWGYQPIHWAAYHDRPEIIELLIAKRADVNAKTSLGQTPLELAVPRRNTATIGVLRKHGARE